MPQGGRDHHGSGDRLAELGLLRPSGSRDVSQRTGMLAVDGRPKAWAREFQRLAGTLAQERIAPATWSPADAGLGPLPDRSRCGPRLLAAVRRIFQGPIRPALKGPSRLQGVFHHRHQSVCCLASLTSAARKAMETKSSLIAFQKSRMSLVAPRSAFRSSRPFCESW